MPTYEYLCQKCGHRFDEFQSIKAPPLKKCPRCKGKVKRVIVAGAGFLFKGSGFYITDYRSKSYKERAKSEGGGSGGSGGSGGAGGSGGSGGAGGTGSPGGSGSSGGTGGAGSSGSSGGSGGAGSPDSSRPKPPPRKSDS